MPVTVSVNGRTVVHAGSGGTTVAFPNVCLTTTPASPVPLPLPYPNVARSADAAQTSRTTTADGHPVCLASSTFGRSTGDEPGRAGGIVSKTNQGEANFIAASLDTEIEGKGVPRALELMLHNKKNTPPFPLVQGPATPIVPSKGHWLELRVRDDKGKPLPGLRYEVELPDGTNVSGLLDDEGDANLVGIKSAGSCKISFPELDKKLVARTRTFSDPQGK